MIDLGVNIDHVATLRQARKASYPDPITAALLAEQAGADLITLHLREDRRHIQDADLFRMRPLLKTRMNLECAVTSEMIGIALRARPHDVCLVPERRQEVTTEGGLDVVSNQYAVAHATAQLQAAGIRVSHFIDPESDQIHAAKKAGATVVELHTGAYAHAWPQSASDYVEAEAADDTLAYSTQSTQQTFNPAAQAQLQRIVSATNLGVGLGLRVNAGHGLTVHNVRPVAQLQGISELNIGHAIIADSVFLGLDHAIKRFKALMIQARSASFNP